MNSKFVSIDIETTGLNEETCQVIEIGAVIDDWLNPMEQQPEFHCYVQHDIYKGEPYALSMHSELFRKINDASSSELLNEWEALAGLNDWMFDNGIFGGEDEDHRKAVVAGKNFSAFDARFIRKMGGHTYFNYHYRVIDPGNLYWNPLTDELLPDTKTCMERAGIKGDVAHTALEDAKVVAKLIQIYVGNQ